MVDIDNIVVNQCKKHIIYGYLNVRSCTGTGIILLDIFNIGVNNTGQFLLQHTVNCFLQLPVYGQINIISGRSVYLLYHFRNPAHTVCIELFRSLGTLQFLVHDLFNTGFANYIIGRIRIAFFGKFIVFRLRNFTGVANNMGKVNTVLIFADTVFHHVNSLKNLRILLNDGNGLITDILSNGGLDIPLIAVLRNGIPQKGNFVCIVFLIKYRILRRFILIFPALHIDAESFLQVFHHLLRCGGTFIIS